MWRLSRLTRDGTAATVSQDHSFLKRERGQTGIFFFFFFSCPPDHEQDRQPYPVILYSAINHNHLHTNGDREISISPVQLTTSRVGNLTRLIYTLQQMMTYIHNTIIHTVQTTIFITPSYQAPTSGARFRDRGSARGCYAADVTEEIQFDDVLVCLPFCWCPCMAINVSVQYDGGFLPDIILLTQCYYHRGTRLNAMKRFCIFSY